MVGPGWGLALGLYEAGHLADEQASATKAADAIVQVLEQYR